MQWRPIRSIEAPDLRTGMGWFLAGCDQPEGCAYTASIDHSPSEQLTGEEQYHSALILSANMAHQAIADSLGPRLNKANRRLRQWKSTGGSSYRRKFGQHLFHELKDRQAFIIGSTATEEAIRSNEAGFAQSLGITDCYRRISQGERAFLEFGPFVDEEGGTPRTIVVPEHWGLMALYTASWLLRVHTELLHGLSRMGLQIPLMPIIEVWSDPPPGSFDGKYADLMWLLLGGPTTSSRFTWGGFTKGNQDIDLLADNVAGWMRAVTDTPDDYQYKGPALQQPITGVFFWDRLEKIPA